MNIKSNLIPIAFITVLVLITAGVLFAIIKLVRGPGNTDEPVKIDLSEPNEVFSSKLEAYEKQVEDSAFSIRDENLRIDLSRVFRKKVDTSEQGEISQMINEVMLPPSPALSENSVARQSQPSRGKTIKKPVTAPVLPAETEETSDQAEQETKLDRKDGFNSSFTKEPASAENSTTVYAVIHQRQTVHQNSPVKLRITREFSLNGTSIPAGTIVYGTASFGNERVLIQYENLSFNGQLFPFPYRTFDTDGIEGIYVPGLVINDVGQETVNQTTANTRVSIPVVGSVAVNTAQRENNKNTAILTQDYKVLLKTN